MRKSAARLFRRECEASRLCGRLIITYVACRIVDVVRSAALLFSRERVVSRLCCRPIALYKVCTYSSLCCKTRFVNYLLRFNRDLTAVSGDRDRKILIHDHD